MKGVNGERRHMGFKGAAGAVGDLAWAITQIYGSLISILELDCGPFVFRGILLSAQNFTTRELAGTPETVVLT